MGGLVIRPEVNVLLQTPSTMMGYLNTYRVTFMWLSRLTNMVEVYVFTKKLLKINIHHLIIAITGYLRGKNGRISEYI